MTPFRAAPRGRRRFRVGATSWVWPQRALENVERLASVVEDVELLLFDVEDPRGLPAAGELAALAALGESAQLTFTVHTPLDAVLGSEDEAHRALGVDRVARAITLGRGLSPWGFPVHAYLGEREGGPPPADPEGWRRRLTDSFTQICERTGVPPDRLCVECLDYDLALAAPVIEALGLSVALDVGHLGRDGRDVEAALERWLPRTRIVQWHGTDPADRDHRSLAHWPRASGVRLVRRLIEASWDGVLTLEVFRPDDLAESLTWLGGVLAEAQG